MVDLSICVLTRNQPLLLPQCIASCLAEVERTKVTAEIIIVDNEKLLALSRSIRVLRNEQNFGFATGNNQAIHASSGRYVLVLNDDAVLQQGCLQLLLQELTSDPGVGAFGPKLLNSDGSLQIGFSNKRFPRIRGMLCEFLPFSLRLYQHSWTRNLFTEWNDGEETGETAFSLRTSRRGERRLRLSLPHSLVYLRAKEIPWC